MSPGNFSSGSIRKKVSRPPSCFCKNSNLSVRFAEVALRDGADSGDLPGYQREAYVLYDRMETKTSI